ncbi:unnamed protein product, partial [Discosporangium mesarthrocarpum]
AHLRGLYGVSSGSFRASFSLRSPLIELQPNSKSRQRFLFTADGQYVLKTATESELKSILLFLKPFAAHLARCRGSLISRFFGVYRVTSQTTGR